VRAIDLTLQDLFADSKHLLFPGNPLEHLEAYRRFTEWSLLVDVGNWTLSNEPAKRELGIRWEQFTRREVPWKMICQRHLVFGAEDAERSSIFADPEFVERKLRAELPPAVAHIPLRIDVARHVHRPGSRGATAGQNFFFDSARGAPRPLSDDQLFRQLPVSHRICRIYAHTDDHAAELAAALDALIGPGGSDDLTNM
jgi:hypothetical protein